MLSLWLATVALGETPLCGNSAARTATTVAVGFVENLIVEPGAVLAGRPVENYQVAIVRLTQVYRGTMTPPERVKVLTSPTDNDSYDSFPHHEDLRPGDEVSLVLGDRGGTHLVGQLSRRETIEERHGAGTWERSVAELHRCGINVPIEDTAAHSDPAERARSKAIMDAWREWKGASLTEELPPPPPHATVHPDGGISDPVNEIVPTKRSFKGDCEPR